MIMMAKVKKFTIQDHMIPVRKPKFVMDTSTGKDTSRGFTLVLAFQRNEMVHNFFAHLFKMNVDMPRCNLLVIDNSDKPALASTLVEKTDKIKHAFNTVRIYKTWRMGGGENIMEDDKGFAHSKLPFIYGLHQTMCRLIQTDQFVLLEDDTLCPPDTVVRLLELLEDNPECGIATALETGRSMVAWSKTRVGVHYMERPGVKLLRRVSPTPYLRGIHKVDACGWYAAASYKDVWESGFRGMNRYLEELPRFALDGVHTNNIRKAGYDILADFNLWCKHVQPMGDKFYFWERKRARPMMDVWLPDWKIYAQQVLLDKPWHAKMLRRLVRQRDRS